MYVDWLGNEIQIGDYIFFSRVTQGSVGRYVGKILEFVDDEYPKVQVVKIEAWSKGEDSVTVLNAFVKVNYKE